MKILAALMVVLGGCTLLGCGDSDADGTGGAGAGGGGGEGGSGDACGDIDTSSCDAVLSPSDDDTTNVQTALIEANSGSTICFCPGQFAFEKELSLTVPDVTLIGLGDSREDVVLDFAEQTDGDDGLTVTSDGFTIEHLSLKNTPGNGIVVTGASDVTFRDLKVSWDAGSVTDNGAYAVYPVSSERVIVEDCEVTGAADAGIYVGQCNEAIVRNNVVYGNVAGIEFENTFDGEAYGNKAYDNSAGILIFLLPNLEQKDGGRTLIYDNEIYDNNRENFAEEGSIVAAVPPGIGVLLLASNDTEIHSNEFRDNESTAILAVSFETLAILLGETPNDPDTDLYLERTYIYDNTYTNNGTDPAGALSALDAPAPLENVIWDGTENPVGGEADLCLSMMPTTFRNFGGVPGIGDGELHSTDTTPHECTLPGLDGVSF